jgi:hypothetical protein
MCYLFKLTNLKKFCFDYKKTHWPAPKKTILSESQSIAKLADYLDENFVTA